MLQPRSVFTLRTFVIYIMFTSSSANLIIHEIYFLRLTNTSCMPITIKSFDGLIPDALSSEIV